MTERETKAYTGFAYIAFACGLAAVVLLAAYFGACANLITPEMGVGADTGGKGETPAIIAAVIAIFAFLYFWPKRYTRMK